MALGSFLEDVQILGVLNLAQNPTHNGQNLTNVGTKPFKWGGAVKNPDFFGYSLRMTPNRTNGSEFAKIRFYATKTLKIK